MHMHVLTHTHIITHSIMYTMHIETHITYMYTYT